MFIKLFESETKFMLKLQTGQIFTISESDLSAPNCLKDFLDLPGDSGQSCLTSQLFPVVILANQV